MSALLPFIAIAVIAGVEFFLARAWLPAYFRYGLPVFRMRVHGVRLDAEAEARIGTVADQRASLIMFKRLSETEIAIREKGRSAPGFRYTPILHGLLRYVPEEGATYVTGFANIFFLAAAGVLGYIFFSSSRYHRPWELVATFAMIFGVMYGIGVWRYRMVARALGVRSEFTGADRATP